MKIKISLIMSIMLLHPFSRYTWNVMPVKSRLLLLVFPLLTGCEFLYDLLDVPNPTKQAEAIEAEGKAVGSACRYSGRSLEDCYMLNPGARKAAVFAGWREMNDYMLMNDMEIVPSKLPQPGESPVWPRPLPGSATGEIIEQASPTTVSNGR